MSQPLEFLGGLTAEVFLKEYWQKKPLFVKGAFKDFDNPVDPDELAGLACEEIAVSRIISGDGKPENWDLKHGPFEPEELTALSEENWTLLVQQVEPFYEELADLKKNFSFIPHWRGDDVMVSFAADGGSVGPHMDLYDVFLIQGLGKRLWKVGGEPIEQEDLLDDCEVKILKSYETKHEWLAEPGDLLYIPPKYVHYGVAQGACMTYSVGFRAPNAYDLLSAFLEDAKDELEQTMYWDSDLTLQDNPGEIRQDAIEKLIATMKNISIDSEQASHWLGRLLTEPKRIVEPVELEVPFSDVEYFREELEDAKVISFHEQVKTSYVINKESNQIFFFALGGEYIFDIGMLGFVKQLCLKMPIPYKDVSLDLNDDHMISLLMSLANLGILYLPAGDDEEEE